MPEISEKELMVAAVKARTDKSISTLKGILLGIMADGSINAAEIT